MELFHFIVFFDVRAVVHGCKVGLEEPDTQNAFRLLSDGGRGTSSLSYLVRPIDESRHFSISNLKKGRACNILVLHNAQLTRDLPVLIKLPAIFPESNSVTGVFQVNLKSQIIASSKTYHFI